MSKRFSAFKKLYNLHENCAVEKFSFAQNNEIINPQTTNFIKFPAKARAAENLCICK